MGAPAPPRVLCHPAAAGLSRSTTDPAGQEDIHGGAGPTHRRDGRHRRFSAGQSRWAPLQHDSPCHVAKEPSTGAGRGHRSIGVDINRNFPMLWKFERYFAPGTIDSTRNPGDYESFVGPRAGSEPETKNVIWLLDRFPQIRFFIDLHSYGETLLHSWGNDQNQAHDRRMCFLNK